MSYNIPYSFIPGTKAKAQEVNANFKYLTDSLTEVTGEKMNKSMSNITNEGIAVIKNNIGSSRNIGEIISSTIPLEDAGLHLLDGALISRTGIYADFVDYIAELYNQNPAASYFCQPNTGKVYNYTTIGTLVNNEGFLSGFSNTNCAKYTTAIPASTNVEIILKVTPMNLNRGHNVIFRPLGTNAPFGLDNNYVPQIFTGSWSNGRTTYSANQTIWLKLIWNGSSNVLYSMADNDYTIDNLPNNWTTEVTWVTTTNIFSGYGFNLGQNDTAPAEYFQGTIDLNNCRIKVNNTTWWEGVSEAVYNTAEEEWQAKVNVYGSCAKFVYDSTNNTVRLPKINGIIEATSNTDNIGDITEAGLPNITGSFSIDIWPNPTTSTGAFAIESHTATYRSCGTGYDNLDGLRTFDASRCSSVYGKSTTVQPQTTKILYYIVVATLSKTEIQIDIDNIATDINTKADADLNNINPSNSAKNIISGFSMADFTTGTTLTSGSILPCNALVVYANTNTSNSARSIGITINDSIEISTETTLRSRGAIALPKGCKITALSGTTITYYALKGAH